MNHAPLEHLHTADLVVQVRHHHNHVNLSTHAINEGPRSWNTGPAVCLGAALAGADEMAGEI